jgi:phosphate transport system protein
MSQAALDRLGEKMDKQPQEKKSSVRRTLEIEVQELRDELLYLGSMVEKQILGSVDVLKKQDGPGSQRIIDNDMEINQMRYAIEEKVMIAIATQQPMAHDLRVLASILEVSGELERMGDYAKGIATISLRSKDQPLLKPLIDLPRMAQKGADMLHRSLTAFVNEDVEVAKAIPNEDDEVDGLYQQIYRELMTFVIEDPKVIQRANWLLWVAHNLERVADRVTNICERTIFSATGEIHEIEHSKKD